MAVAMLRVAWNTNPSKGGNTAPPMIAITIIDPPSFVLGPSPLIPRAKIVGNIKDMKKLVRKNAQTPTQPGKSTPVATSARLTIP